MSKKAFLKNLVIFTGKQQYLESFVNKVTSRTACNVINKKLQHRWFPVNLAKFLKTAFFTEHLHLFSEDSQNGDKDRKKLTSKNTDRRSLKVLKLMK